MDPFQVLQTAIAPSLDAIKSNAERNFGMAVRRADQNREDANRMAMWSREDARTASERAYQEKLEQRRHDQKKTDEDEARKRSIRNQYAALLPTGSVIPADMSEEDMLSEISNRTRMRAIEYSKEDKDRTLQFEIEKAKKLSDEELKRKAEELGVPWDPENKAKVHNEIALASAKQTLEVQATIAKQKIAAARALPEYPSLRKRYADYIYERNMLMSSLAFPEPTFNASISPKDREDIYKEIARMPEIIEKFAKFKDGIPRLVALERGDFLSAIKGLKEDDRVNLANILSENSGNLEKRMLSDRSMEYQGGVKSYVERLRTLPQRLAEVDRKISELYKTGEGTSLDAGLALRFEDPDALLQERHDSDRAEALNVNGVPTTPSSAPSSALPLPPVGAFQSTSPARVEGIIPRILGRVGDVYEGAASDPLLADGLSQFSRGVSQNLDAVGSGVRDSWVNLFGGQLSNKSPSINISDPLQGIAKTVVSPFNMLGRGMRHIANVDDGNLPVPPIVNPQH